MDNPFEDSPFEEAVNQWAVPDGTVPHEDTIKMLQGLGGFGVLTNKELLTLAYYLNDHRDARHAWPGEKLVHMLAELFNDRTPTHDDREDLHRDLNAIEKECSRMSRPPSDAEAEIASNAIRVEDLPLPDLDKVSEVQCEEARSAFEVNLKRQQCSCPAWPNHRAKLKHGDIRRCCSHMAEAYLNEMNSGGIEDAPPVFKALMEDRVRRGRSLDPRARWKVLKIKLRPHLAVYGHTVWSYVFAPETGGGFVRYSFNTEEKRWAFGRAPNFRAAIEKFLLNGDKPGPA